MELVRDQEQHGRMFGLEVDESMWSDPIGPWKSWHERRDLWVETSHGRDGGRVYITNFATLSLREKSARQNGQSAEGYMQRLESELSDMERWSCGSRLAAEEKLAKFVLDQKDFSVMTCERVIRATQLSERHAPRAGIEQGNHYSPMYVFGLFCHGGVWGVTNRTRRRPYLCRYLNAFLDHHGGDPQRTSLVINAGATMKAHRDVANLQGTRNSLITFGDHVGGRLWAADEALVAGGQVGRSCTWEIRPGETKTGVMVNPFHQMVTFDAKKWHSVEPWKGTRISLAGYTLQALERIDKVTRRQLRSLGFKPTLSRGRQAPLVPRGGEWWSDNVSYALRREGDLRDFPVLDREAGELPEDDEEMETPGEAAELKEESQSLRLTDSQRRLIHKIHVNVGHPPAERFLRMLQAAGALPQVMKYVKEEYQCDQCSIKRRADHRFRARCPRSFEFNRALAVDTMYVNFGGYKVPVLNMTDTGTGYQVTQRLPIATGSQGGTPTSESTWRAFLHTWIKYLGAPEVLICDGGAEFKAAFERGCESHGILQTVTPAESPWKNGIAERHGGFIKDKLEQELASGKCVIQTWEDIDDYLTELTSVKNRWLYRGGFTPVQLVFGQMPRVAGELLTDDTTALMGLQDVLEDPSGVDQATGEFRRRMQIRESARQRAMEQASRDAVQRSLRTTTHQGRDWKAGQWVYVFRRGQANNPLHPRSRWVGPGLIVLANNSTIYVGMRTRLWRCSPEQLRAAHPMEELGHHLAQDSSAAEVLRRVLSGAPAGAVDVRREGPPPEGAPMLPVERHGEGPRMSGSMEAPQHAPLQVPPVPPGLLLPAELPDPTLQEPGGAGAPSRRSSTVAEPASEPISRQASPSDGLGETTGSRMTPGPMESIAEERPEEELGGDSRPITRPEPEEHAESPPAKMARMREPEEGASSSSTRAPGTPMQPLLNIIRTSSIQSGSEVAPSLTPGESLPLHGRVEQQVQEWERLRRDDSHFPGETEEERQNEHSFWTSDGMSWENFANVHAKEEKAANPVGDGSSVVAKFESEDWSGTFFNYQNGSVDLMLDEENEWNFAAKRGDEVQLRDLAVEERKMFAGSDLAEWESILGTNAVKVLRGREAQKAREQYPSRILSSRMVRRKKPVEGLGQWKAKSRWCIHGHKDPDTGSLSTYAPTPSGESLMLFLQSSLNLSHVFAFADVKSAFCQSNPIRRPAGPIFAQPCEGLNLPKDALIQILVPVYGLDDAPVAWRETVVSYLIQEGYERNVIEPCWFSKFDEARENCSQVMVEVDDFIITSLPGDAERLKKKFMSRWKFGKWVEGSADYAGRMVTVKADRLEISQEKYILEQVHPILLARDRKRAKESRLSEEEFHAFRSIVYKKTRVVATGC